MPIAIIEGPIITVIAGFLASQGYFNIAVVYFVTVLGDLLGDLMYYAIGRFGHRIARSRIGRFLGVKDNHLSDLKSHFDYHSGKTLLLGKLTHSLGMVILTSAGMARMSVGTFLWYNLIGSIPKTLVLVLIGYYTGHALAQINSTMDNIFLVVGIVFTIGIGSYIAFRYFSKKKSQ